MIAPAAARIGIAVATGVGLGHMLGLGHAYWVGLTAAGILMGSKLGVSTYLARRFGQAYQHYRARVRRRDCRKVSRGACPPTSISQPDRRLRPGWSSRASRAASGRVDHQAPTSDQLLTNIN